MQQSQENNGSYSQPSEVSAASSDQDMVSMPITAQSILTQIQDGDHVLTPIDDKKVLAAVDDVFDIPKLTSKDCTKSKRKTITMHRLLTSENIIEEKRKQEQEKQKKERQKQERKAKREEKKRIKEEKKQLKEEKEN